MTRHDSVPPTADALRAWAKGAYPLEAGVELLIRTGFADAGFPWIRTTAAGQSASDPARWWVDAEAINAGTAGVYSGGEQRVLRIAAALLDGEAVSLYEDVPGLDRQHLALVLAAIAHVGGSHEHSGPPQPDPEGRFVINGVRHGFSRLPSLYSWPEGQGR